jgi:asparagine synthetase B (glutamine-hydrolysing)
MVANRVPLEWSELYVSGAPATIASGCLDSGSVTFTTEDRRRSTRRLSSVGCATRRKSPARSQAGGRDHDGRHERQDVLTLEAFPRPAPVMLGGEGGDELFGGKSSEDMLVDGNGSGADT